MTVTNKQTLFPLFFLLFAGSALLGQARQSNCDNPVAQIDLNINAVRARITTNGSLWNDGSNGAYSVTADDGSPNVNPVSAIYTGNLWIGGMDPGGALKIAAQQYGLNRFDYYPGPLDDQGVTDADQCARWDRFFPILQEDVRSFVSSYDPQNPPSTSQISANIAGWPATGNPLFESVNGFTLPTSPNGYAPFQDVNEDGIYNPLDGDYPLFCGDQAIWCIFNDAGNVHAGSGTPTQVQAEIHLLAYAYADNDSILHRTTFYDYKIINRSQETISDFYAGHWIDSDLGCYTNDLNNSSPENNLFYVYNANGAEAENCAEGGRGYGATRPVNIFQVVYSDAEASQQEETPLMSSFISLFNNGVGGPTPATTEEPDNAIEYYNVLTGSWTDGTPLTRGGNGYQTGGEVTSYAYDGGEANGESWTHCNVASGAVDSRQVYSTGPYDLDPGSEANFTLAVTTIFGVDYSGGTCPDTNQVFAAASHIKGIYDDNCSRSVLTSDRTPRSPASIGLEIFPNPTAGEVTFRLPAPARIDRVEVTDLTGRLLTTARATNNELRFDLKAAGLPAGIYLYRLRTSGGAAVAGRLVLME